MEKNNVCETNQDILKALQQQIADLQKEIEVLQTSITKEPKSRFQLRHLYSCMTAQKELDYIFNDTSNRYVYYQNCRVPFANTLYNPIKNAATICVMSYSQRERNCKLKTLREMDDTEFQFVIECADEITRVIASKKKEFQKAKYENKVFA